MSDIFKKHIAKFTQVSDDEFGQIIKFFDTREVAKKQNLLEEGQLYRHHYFVLQDLAEPCTILQKKVQDIQKFGITIGSDEEILLSRSWA